MGRDKNAYIEGRLMADMKAKLIVLMKMPSCRPFCLHVGQLVWQLSYSVGLSVIQSVCTG